jgi:hypothetical protein
MTDVVIPALTRDDQAAPRSSQAAGAAMKLLAIAEAFKRLRRLVLPGVAT